jgi:hypothetical protein
MRRRLKNNLKSAQSKQGGPKLRRKLMRDLDVQRKSARTPLLKNRGEQKGDDWRKKKGSRWRA